MSDTQPIVFIVDDDDDVRDSISELVESVGLTAAGAWCWMCEWLK